MAVTAIYFVASGPNAPGLADLTDRLIRAYDPVWVGSWGLHHRVFRSTPANTSDKSPPHSQHVLGLGHHPDRAFVHITGPDQPQAQAQAQPPVAPSSTIAIPLSQMEPYSQLLNLKFGALWMYRIGSQVTSGASYSLGEFVVRLGELREKGGQMALRGTVVCIQTAQQESEDQDMELLPGQTDPQDELEASQSLVRDVWSSFGVGANQARESITSRPPREAADDTFDEVGLWCDILRFQK